MLLFKSNDTCSNLEEINFFPGEISDVSRTDGVGYSLVMI